MRQHCADLFARYRFAWEGSRTFCLSEARVPFERPRGDELRRRMKSVLSVVYLVFNEGYCATSAEVWMRAALCDEALRLGRLLVHLLPEESDAHAPLALMELDAADDAGPSGTGVAGGETEADGRALREAVATIRHEGRFQPNDRRGNDVS